MVTQYLFLQQATVLILRSTTKAVTPPFGVRHFRLLRLTTLTTGTYVPTIQKAPTAVASAIQSVVFANNVITIYSSTKYHEDIA